MKEYDEITLKKLQNIELMILKDFIELCENNHLDYFGIAGTNIGVIRHHGFIPWDDDIDVALPRKDYDKFILLAKQELSEKYIVMNAEENENYPLMTTRLMLKNTRFREYALKDIDCELGIFLDIYPFDNLSDNYKKRKKQMRDAWFFSKLLILRSIPKPVLGFAGWKAKVILAICTLIHYVLRFAHVSKKWLYSKCLEASTRHNDEINSELIDFLCDTTPTMNIHNRSDVFPLQTLDFEGIKMKFPNNMLNNLNNLYGDIMIMPPVEKRKNHFPYEFDFGEY